MTNKMMVLFASAALTLVACSDKDSGGDDSGAADGTDSADGTTDGTDGGPVAVTGGAANYWIANDQVGTWSITGETISCGDCMFGFSGDFAVTADSEFGADFSRDVTWDAAGYVYTDAGEYWGYGGGDGNGEASFYSYTYTNYLYYGYVNY